MGRVGVSGAACPAPRPCPPGQRRQLCLLIPRRRLRKRLGEPRKLQQEENHRAAPVGKAVIGAVGEPGRGR